MKRSLILLLISLLSLNFLSAQSLESVKQSADADLEAALSELATLRAEIRKEKIPLAQERRNLEADARSLRSEAEAVRAVQDNADLRLDQLRSQIKGREEEVQYATNLLNEYVRGLQARIHVSEVEKYEPKLLEILDSAEVSEDGEASIAKLASGISLGLERAKDISGGTIFPGGAVLPDGSFTQGSFVLAGPLAYFTSEKGGGLVIRGDSLRPAIEPIPDMDVNAAVAAVASNGTGSIPIDGSMGNARAIEQTKETIMEHIQKGGVWIVPILGFALVSMVIAAFKALELYSIKTPAEGTVAKLVELIKDGKHDEATEAAAHLPGPSGDMLRIGVRHSGESVALVEELCIEKVVETQPRVTRLLSFVATTAAVSPLLGLLGTVTGMINTFKLITIFGTGDARSLSSGISEALITTEFGLIVAIPALILHAILSRRANGILATMEKQAIGFVNGLKIAREK
ncbi:MotA/TolQ/ExbB proton channel family protein [Coraliomargarita sp. W4R53]